MAAGRTDTVTRRTTPEVRSATMIVYRRDGIPNKRGYHSGFDRFKAIRQQGRILGELPI
jgi:hypothetical protein